MREIAAQIVFIIDGKEHVFKTCDFTECINEAIKDGVIEDENNVDEIMEYIYFERCEL